MRVRLIAHTPDPEKVCGAAARSCYSSDPASELVDTDTSGALRHAIAYGHLSVLEHATFTFSVEGVSRVLTHQLVRHRLASFSQQSQRYVKFDGAPEVVMPRTVEEALDRERVGTDSRSEEELRNALENYICDLNVLIDTLHDHGVPEEDIRYFFPQGSATNITFTMNLRELSHFLGLRRCARAQEEIRYLADEIAEIMAEVFPLFAGVLFGPQCDRLGYCPEKSKGCGRHRQVGV